MQPKTPVLLACLATLAACAQQAPPPSVDATVPAVVPQQGTVQQAAASASGSAGRARVCETSRVGRHRTGNSQATPMTVSNEGGWCRKGFTRNGGYPFMGGNIVNQPQHGEARVRHLANNTVIEYRPNPGYTGDDSFVAELTPGSGRYPVQVTVQP